MKGCGRIEFAPIWADCIGLEFDTGGWVFHKQDEGVWEVHTLFLPKSRDVLQNAQQALRYMFTEADAQLIVTQVATDLPHVRRLALAGGFQWFARKEGAWERDSGPVTVDYYELTRDAWANMEQGRCQQQD